MVGAKIPLGSIVIDLATKEIVAWDKKREEEELSDDSDFVLRDEEDEEESSLQRNTLGPFPSFEDFPSSCKSTQKSKGSDTQATYISEDSNDLFTSPLPPTPPSSEKKSSHVIPVKLSPEMREVTNFLKQFRTSNDKDEDKDVLNTSPSKLRHNSKIDSHRGSPDKSSLPGNSKSKLQDLGSDSPVLKEKHINKTSNSTPGKKVKKSYVVVCSGLSLDQMQEVQKISQMNGCKFQVKFDSTVTHLVVKTVPAGSLVCERTLKVFQALSRKCWIVDYQWISNSKKAGYLVPEVEFEVIGDSVTENSHFGPKRARLSEVPLLKNLHVCPVGCSSDFTQANLKELVEACGGTVMSHISEFMPKGCRALIIRCEDFDDEENIPPPDVMKEINSAYREYGLVSVSREWFLDSLTVYHLQPLKEYILTSVNCVLPQIIL